MISPISEQVGSLLRMAVHLSPLVGAQGLGLEQDVLVQPHHAGVVNRGDELQPSDLGPLETQLLAGARQEAQRQGIGRRNSALAQQGQTLQGVHDTFQIARRQVRTRRQVQRGADLLAHGAEEAQIVGVERLAAQLARHRQHPEHLRAAA
jgi:hypothetical protein